MVPRVNVVKEFRTRVQLRPKFDISVLHFLVQALLQHTVAPTVPR